uniref:Uncharacterized protein n=1 Tax=Acrobeloides nanus TaxID=290746 RepID=A0A914CDK1_9BILA
MDRFRENKSNERAKSQEEGRSQKTQDPQDLGEQPQYHVAAGGEFGLFLDDEPLIFTHENSDLDALVNFMLMKP